MMRARFVSLLVVSVCLSAPSHAHAQEPAGSPDLAGRRAEARELMREGSELYKAGQKQEAYERFVAAWNQAKGFDVACNLGQAAFDLGRSRDAAQFLDWCLRHYSLSSREDVVRIETEARRKLGEAKARVGAITISVEPNGAAVLLDDKPVEADFLDGTIYVDPGSHRLEAQLQGYRPGAATVLVNAGAESTVRLSLESSSPAAIPRPEPPADAAPGRAAPEKPSHAPALIAGGVAVVGLVTGVGFLVAAGSKDSERDDQLKQLAGGNRCGSGTPRFGDCSAIVELANDAKTFRVVSYTSFGIGAVGAVAAVLLWPKSHDRAGAAFVFPFAGNGSAGVSAAGAF